MQVEVFLRKKNEEEYVIRTKSAQCLASGKTFFSKTLPRSKYYWSYLPYPNYVMVSDDAMKHVQEFRGRANNSHSTHSIPYCIMLVLQTDLLSFNPLWRSG